MASSETVIKVENLSKLYRIGLKENIHDSLLRAFLDFLRSPVKNYRRYRSLYSFDEFELQETKDRDGNGDVIWALKEVSFQVKEGEVVGIIGRNGAGKSTLLKILSRITDPTVGVAYTRGRISSLLEVGTGFHHELTGRENVYLNGAVLGMRKKEIDRKFNDIVEFSGISKFIDTPVKRYSSGMTVRLAFSVAAHLEPELLVIDEVLAVGDADFQKKCLNKMEDVGKQGRTVLFVSHNMPAVTRLCERVILLDEGRLVADGPAQKVVSTYLTSNLGTKAAREWVGSTKSPGGDTARLRAVRVVSENGCISDNIDIRKQFKIEMEYEILEPGLVLRPIFGLMNEEGQYIFHTIDQDPKWRGRARPKGCYTSTVFVPGNLLSEGMVFCNCALMSVNPDSVLFFEKSVVAFMVYDSMDGDSARGDYPRTIPGVVRPLLKWRTEFSTDRPESG